MSRHRSVSSRRLSAEHAFRPNIGQPGKSQERSRGVLGACRNAPGRVSRHTRRVPGRHRKPESESWSICQRSSTRPDHCRRRFRTPVPSFPSRANLRATVTQIGVTEKVRAIHTEHFGLCVVWSLCAARSFHRLRIRPDLLFDLSVRTLHVHPVLTTT